jgi:photosystem II stability/assembly factor-like uncharacterized protein
MALTNDPVFPLFHDKTKHRTGLGTYAPAGPLHVVKEHVGNYHEGVCYNIGSKIAETGVFSQDSVNPMMSFSNTGTISASGKIAILPPITGYSGGYFGFGEIVGEAFDNKIFNASFSFYIDATGAQVIVITSTPGAGLNCLVVGDTSGKMCLIAQEYGAGISSGIFLKNNLGNEKRFAFKIAFCRAGEFAPTTTEEPTTTTEGPTTTTEEPTTTTSAPPATVYFTWGNSTPKIYISYNMRIWSYVGDLPTGTTRVVCGNNTLVAIAPSESNPGNNGIFYSKDYGTTWEEVTSLAYATIIGLDFVFDKFFVLVKDSDWGPAFIGSSSDGILWSIVNGGWDGIEQCKFFWFNGKYSAIGSISGGVSVFFHYEDDTWFGMNITPTESYFVANDDTIAVSDSNIIAILNNNTSWASADGINWTKLIFTNSEGEIHAYYFNRYFWILIKETSGMSWHYTTVQRSDAVTVDISRTEYFMNDKIQPIILNNILYALNSTMIPWVGNDYRIVNTPTPPETVTWLTDSVGIPNTTQLKQLLEMPIAPITTTEEPSTTTTEEPSTTTTEEPTDLWEEEGIIGNWSKVAVSASGKYQTAVNFNSKIHISSDYGETWAAKDAERGWIGIAMSSTGKIQIALFVGGAIFKSVDYGETWTPIFVENNVIGLAVSSTCQYQAVVTYVGKHGEPEEGRIYISSDYGETWTAKDSGRTWSSVAISKSGQYVAATVNGGQIYESHDYGETWTAKGYSGPWLDIAMDSTGKYQTAIAVNRESGIGTVIYISSDHGETWQGIGAHGYSWSSVAINSTGQHQVITINGGQIYESHDFGHTWYFEERSRNWKSVAISSNGYYQVAVVENGNIYQRKEYLGNISILTDWTTINVAEIFKTNNMTTWGINSITGIGSSILISSCFESGLFIAGSNDGKIFTSPNGIDWTQRYSCDSAFNKVSYFPKLGLFIAVGSIIITSPNGYDWTQRYNASDILYDVAYNEENMLVVVGDNGKILNSTDGGMTWTPITTIIPTSGNTIQCVIWDGNSGFGFILACSTIAYPFGTVFYTSTHGNDWILSGDAIANIGNAKIIKFNDDNNYYVGGLMSGGTSSFFFSTGLTGWTPTFSPFILENFSIVDGTLYACGNTPACGNVSSFAIRTGVGTFSFISVPAVWASVANIVPSD